MRFHSTPESALNGEITVLGIIETTAAVSLYLWAGLHFGTFKYLAVATVSAPLMLLRTDVSARWCLQVYQRWSQFVWPRSRRTHRSDPVSANDSILAMVFRAIQAILSSLNRIEETFSWPLMED